MLLCFLSCKPCKYSQPTLANSSSQGKTASSWSLNFLKTFFQVVAEDRQHVTLSTWAFPISCCHSVENKTHYFFEECEETSLLEPFLLGVCTRSSFGSWVWREKSDLTAVALGISMSQWTSCFLEFGCTLAGRSWVQWRSHSPAPITFTSSPNQDLSKSVNFLSCALTRMTLRPFTKHTWT